MYLALDDEAAQGFSRLAGPRAQIGDKPPSSSQGSMFNKLFQGCFCGASPGSIQVRLEIQDAGGRWSTRDVPQNLSAIMIENLPKRWATGEEFWEGDNTTVRHLPNWSVCVVALLLYHIRDSFEHVSRANPKAMRFQSCSVNGI